MWQFLLELLADSKHSDTISWLNARGDFRILDPDNLAYLWGQRKNKPAMTYDKLCRALRYYYSKNILIKIAGKKYMYRFLWQGVPSDTCVGDFAPVKQTSNGNVWYPTGDTTSHLLLDPLRVGLSDPVRNSFPEPLRNSYPESLRNSYPEPLRNSYPEPFRNSYPESVRSSYPTACRQPRVGGNNNPLSRDYDVIDTPLPVTNSSPEVRTVPRGMDALTYTAMDAITSIATYPPHQYYRHALPNDVRAPSWINDGLSITQSLANHGRPVNRALYPCRYY